MAHANWSFSSKRIDVSEWLLKNVRVEEHDSIKRLVLGHSRDVFPNGKVCQKTFQLFLAWKFDGNVLQSVNVAAKPVDVSGFGGKRLVLTPYDLSQPLDGLC